GDGNDILRCRLTMPDTTVGCEFSLFWDGGAHGVNSIDALHIVQPRAAQGTVTGQVFLDQGYDGQRDGGDSGWADVAVKLRTLFGVIDSTTTDATGLYTFPAWPGRYAIEVAGQAGYAFVPQDVGDDATDSDVGADGRSATHVLSSTQTIVLDAGLGIPPTPTPTNTPTPTPTPTPTSTPTATPTQPQSPLPTATQPQSPLPTPRTIPLPNGVSETAVYVIQNSDYETVLSASVREDLWSRGEPVPDTVPAEQLPSTALRHSKPGLLSLASSPLLQSSTPGWVSIYSENFDTSFPGAGQYGDCSLELRSDDATNYQWGGNSFRTFEESAGAAWPAKGGNLGALLTPGSDTYPEDIKTQIICHFSNLNAISLKNVMVEFALWLDEGDHGDSFFMGFNTGESLYYGKRWRQTPVDENGTRLWQQYRFFYPELEDKVIANNGNLSIMWQFESDGNERTTAQGAWLDNLNVERYVQPSPPNGLASCEDLDPTLTVVGVPGDAPVSKGLNLPPYAVDNGDRAGQTSRLQQADVDWIRLEFKADPNMFYLLNSPSPLTPASIDLKHFDIMIDDLCANGIGVLGLLSYEMVLDRSWEEAGVIS
ncbi:MAG: hypothetical protein KDE19_09245, partial [Caldilineaceae bacterium]|nr:hypothetical protein [Caldilineaceae bacterium]